jgi:hypothetical protein
MSEPSVRQERSVVALRARFVTALAVVCLLAWPGRTAAAPADDDIWGSIRLPGGVAAARRVVGLGDGPRQKTTFLIDFTRFFFTTAVNRQRPAIETFVRYLTFLNDTERSLAGWPEGLAIVNGAPRDRQDGFRDFVERLGLRARTDRGRTVVELSRDASDLERHAWLLALGVQVREIVDRLNAGESVRLVIPTDELPLPLPALWGVVFEKSKEPLAELVSSERALFTYLGLMELDRPTLEWIGGHPDTFHRIYQDRSTMFGAFGGALRIQDGVVVVPGGAPAVPLWEDLTGASVSAPAQFLANLLERNNGRLAYFYSTAAAADVAHQSFLLGLAAELKEPRARLRYVQDIRDRFAEAIPTWDIGVQPLLRPPIDPALAILTIDIDRSGGVGPTWWPSVFDRVANADGWPTRPADTLKELKVRPADAAWLLSFVFDRPDQIAERWAWVRFAQRKFSSFEQSAAPDIEIALRAFKDMPTLVPSLERMGVSDPAVFADVARAARRLADAGAGADVDAVLNAWQGALATLEQVVRHRPIRADVLTPLLKSLAASVSTRPLDASGNVASWFLHNLLPALKATADADENMESVVFRRLLTDDGRKSSVFDWEGVPYRLDTLGPTAVSAAALRAVMPGPRLQHLTVLDECTRKLAKPLPTLEALSAVVIELEHVSKPWPNELLVEAIKELRQIRKPKDVQRATKQVPRLRQVVDAATSEIMPGFVYALAMSPTDQPARLFADGPGTHELSSRENTGRLESFAWRLGQATTREKGGTAIRGSLLGLDVARAAEQLTVIAGGPGVIGRPGGAVRDATRDRLAERTGLRATIDWAAEGRDVAAAIGRGRSQVAAWKSTRAPAEAELAKAGFSQGRQNQLQWLMQRREWAAVDRFVTVMDLYHLGTPADLPRGWGQSGRGIESCWCILGVGRQPVERFRGYAIGHASTAVVDLFLRLAEVLTQMQLPTVLIEPMLPFAIQDALDQADQLHPDDWEPLTWAGLVTDARVEQYLQALVARHILAAPDKSPLIPGSPR